MTSTPAQRALVREALGLLKGQIDAETHAALTAVVDDAETLQSERTRAVDAAAFRDLMQAASESAVHLSLVGAPSRPYGLQIEQSGRAVRLAMDLQLGDNPAYAVRTALQQLKDDRCRPALNELLRPSLDELRQRVRERRDLIQAASPFRPWLPPIATS